MSLFRYMRDHPAPSPIERMMVRVFNDALDAIAQPQRSNIWLRPYWLDQAPINQCNIGNMIGQVINTNEKFGVEVDVSQFHPEELSVDVRDRELIVEGKHEERSDESGTIQRHFIRKYIIPEDVHLDSLESHLSDKGVLSVSAKKIVLGKPPSRNIPIKTSSRPDSVEQGKPEGGKEEAK